MSVAAPPYVTPAAVSTAWRTIPASTASGLARPLGARAPAAAALAMPTFPGVSGRRAASSSAGTTTKAARRGEWIATAANTLATAPILRPHEVSDRTINGQRLHPIAKTTATGRRANSTVSRGSRAERRSPPKIATRVA
jgi:hypothetical protein